MRKKASGEFKAFCFLSYKSSHGLIRGPLCRSVFVRHRLTPLLTRHGAKLVISGHQHAYSRGYLPHSLHRPFTAANSSASLPPSAVATVKERGWERASAVKDTIIAEGTVYVICGGAGGTLDTDKVEDWGFYDASITERYHFGSIRMDFGLRRGKPGTSDRKYLFKAGCEKPRVDALEWRAIDLHGQVLDSFVIESSGVQRVTSWCNLTAIPGIYANS